MTRILLIGPPGSGKGTQAEYLAKQFSIPPISTGDIFRAHVKNQTELGMRAQAFIDRGAYVPDDLTNEIVNDRLQAPDARDGFILDGYPRTPEQVVELDRILAAAGTHLNAVIQLRADPEALSSRLVKRAREQGRTDDTEEIIRRRIELYEAQTAPLVDLYTERNLVDRIDALGSVDTVTDRILSALAKRIRV